MPASEAPIRLMIMTFSIKVADDDLSFTATAGEAQATFVPPKTKPNVTLGRFVASNDLRRPPDRGLVLSRDLSQPTVAPTDATFDPVPNAADYSFLTNDHDLLAFPNGDLLYITGAGSRRPLNPKPAWFDVTYRLDTRFTPPLTVIGPGARSVVLVWRSTDGGQSFQFLSEMDPARLPNPAAAFPQFPRRTQTPGTASKPVFDMGGTDGQLATIDWKTNTVYLTFQAVGYKQDTSVTDHFELSSTGQNFTWVLASYDRGASWKVLGSVPARVWRGHLAVLRDDVLVFGVGTSIYFAWKASDGHWVFDQTSRTVPGASWGWEPSFENSTKIKNARRFIAANMHAHTLVVGNGWDDQCALIFPDTVREASGATSHGYRIFYYHRRTATFVEADPVLPITRTTDNWTMHLAAIDLHAPPRDSGHVLLYWYDMSGDKMSGVVRGRVIAKNGEHSEDFAVSRAAGGPRAFSFDQGRGGYWYGDYHTARGYSQPNMPQDIQTHRYFPMWVEPDGTIRYTDVQVRLGLPAATATEPSGAAAGMATSGMDADRHEELPVDPVERDVVLTYGQRAVHPSTTEAR